MNPSPPDHLNRLPPPELPAPAPEERAHSERLVAHIRAAMEREGGSIDFARFMELALYAPGLGYYSAGKHKLGAAGDFITAPELSPVYARCLAVQCEQVLRMLGGGDLLEVGAGSGVLAADLLAALAERGCLPKHYYILELSADLRARQEELIRTRIPALAARVHWLSALPGPGFRGVVLANELLDALPAQRFFLDAAGPRWLRVGWEDGRFVWQAGGPAAEAAGRTASLGLAPGYVSEINLQAEAWIASIAERLEAGLTLLVDYGFPRAEYYHPQRDQGTLMCHYRHRAHGDPLILPGLQDITSHVDFTAIAEAGHAAGLSVLGYTSQAAFLLATGIVEAAAASDTADTQTHLALTTQIKKLTLPSEMGELFKVIALGRGLRGPLTGFAVQDRRGRL